MSLVTSLGVQYPIFLAPMAGVSSPELASAVSEAGGLGSLGLGGCNAAQAYAAILATQQLTDKPIHVNFFAHQDRGLDSNQAREWIEYLAPHFQHIGQAVPSTLIKPYGSFIDHDELLEVILATRPAVVSFHFGLPGPAQLRRLRSAGIPYWVSVTRLSEALFAESQGCAAVIAQGIEAGGHRATFDPLCDSGLSSQALLAQLLGKLTIPIISAGGIMCGKQISDYLSAGASAVQLGTAFIPCTESAASPEFRQALLAATATQITDVISGRPARGIVGTWQEIIDSPRRPAHAGYPYSYALAKQLDKLARQQGDGRYAPYWAGSGVAKLRVLDAAPLMQHLVKELMAEDALFNR